MATEPPNPGEKAFPPVPPGTGQEPPAQSAAPNPAAVLSAKHGGLAGGKPRKDGFVPGSPQAMEADRKKDRDRKAAARAVAEKLQQPPTLPSANLPGQPPPAMPGGAPVPPVGPVPGFVPWQPEILAPICQRLVTIGDSLHCGKMEKLARKANLPEKVVAEIEKNSHFQPSTRIELQESGSRVAAKLLNKTGMSAEHADELRFSVALTSCLMEIQNQTRELKVLIATADKDRKQESASPPVPASATKNG